MSLSTDRRRTRVLSQTLLCTEVSLTVEYDDIIQYSLSDIMYAPLLPPIRDKFPTHLILFDESPWPRDEFRKILSFYGEKLLAPRPKTKEEEHTLTAVRDCLCSIFAATLHIWRPYFHFKWKILHNSQIR